jgi:hypothetical protein
MSGTSEQPYAFSDLDLARRLERAEASSNAKFVEARATAFPESGARWIEVAGAYSMYDGPSSPVTQTFGLGLFQPITARELEEIEGFFRQYGAPVFHEVSPLAGISLFGLLNERGYQPVELTSVMHRPLRRGVDLTLSRNEKIRVRLVGEDDQELWAQTAAQGWSESADLSEFLSELRQINPHWKDMVSFLAELDGQTIAAAGLSISARVALLAGACTVPAARKQGAQLALLDSRLRYAAGQGCDIAMMCAQPGTPSQRNAERDGFRIAYTRIKWRLA